MEWYFILLLVIAGIAALFLLIGFIAALAASNIIIKPKGINRLSFEQVRSIQTKLGGDFEAYDHAEKEPFTIDRGNGITLACEFLPAPELPEPGQPHKCLIRVHGFSQNRLISARFVPLAQAMGYSMLVYDQRGFGESTGFCSFGHHEKNDLVALVKWVRARLGEDCIIGLHGESMGAITILEALDGLDGIAYAIADSSCASVYSLVKTLTHLPAFPILSIVNLWMNLRYRISLKGIRPVDKVSRSNIPVLFFHGTADKQIPFAECPKLFTAANNPLSRMAAFEGAEHCMGHALEKERYEAIARDFVKQAEAALHSPTKTTAG